MATIKYDDSSIQSMTMMEHIRNKYSMYVGAADLDADVQLFKEILDNSVDESLDANKIYRVKVIFFNKGDRYQVAIMDEGRGVPCGRMAEIYTMPFTSGKYNAKAYNGLSTARLVLVRKPLWRCLRSFWLFLNDEMLVAK